MNCKQAKKQVALLIGNDLEPAALQQVRSHLGQCVGCRQHFEQLSNCLEVLQTPARPWSSDDQSLWPALSARLASTSAGQKPHRLSGWAPTLAVAAACTAMFWVASSHFAPNQPVGQPMIDGIQVQPQPVVDPAPSFDDEAAPARKQNRSRPHRALRDPSGDQSDIMPYQGPNSSGIPVVPVSEPAH